MAASRTVPKLVRLLTAHTSFRMEDGRKLKRVGSGADKRPMKSPSATRLSVIGAVAALVVGASGCGSTTTTTTSTTSAASSGTVTVAVTSPTSGTVIAAN